MRYSCKNLSDYASEATTYASEATTHASEATTYASEESGWPPWLNVIIIVILNIV